MIFLSVNIIVNMKCSPTTRLIGQSYHCFENVIMHAGPIGLLCLRSFSVFSFLFLIWNTIYDTYYRFVHFYFPVGIWRWRWPFYLNECGNIGNLQSVGVYSCVWVRACIWLKCLLRLLFARWFVCVNNEIQLKKAPMAMAQYKVTFDVLLFCIVILCV